MGKVTLACTIGVCIITYILLGVPYYSYSINMPQHPTRIIKAPILLCTLVRRWLASLFVCLLTSLLASDCDLSVYRYPITRRNKKFPQA